MQAQDFDMVILCTSNVTLGEEFNDEDDNFAAGDLVKVIVVDGASNEIWIVDDDGVEAIVETSDVIPFDETMGDKFVRMGASHGDAAIVQYCEHLLSHKSDISNELAERLLNVVNLLVSED